MKKYISVIMFLLILPITTTLAINGHITGTIVDKTYSQPIPYANIKVLNLKDSTFVSGTISDSLGNFSVFIKKLDSYILEIKSLGYENKYIHLSVSSSKGESVGIIKLKEKPISLKTAVVTGQMPAISVIVDTTQYNPAAFRVSESAVVEELLKKIPGIDISAKGDINVNGKNINSILVDGKPFLANDKEITIKNLPVKIIDKLQVYNKKSEKAKASGFDDNEENNVLDIKIKKELKKGFLGNASAGYGSKGRYVVNSMINYIKGDNNYTLITGLNNTNNESGGWVDHRGTTKSGKIGGNVSQKLSPTLRFNGSINYDSSVDKVTSKSVRQNILKDGNTFQDQNMNNNSISEGVGYNFNIEWQPDSLTRITFRPNLYTGRNRSFRKQSFTTRNADNKIINYGSSDYSRNNRRNNFMGDLSAIRQLRKSGRVLSFDLTINSSNNKNNAINNSQTYYSKDRPEDLLDQHLTNRDNNNNLYASFSYVEPLSKKYLLEISYGINYNASGYEQDAQRKDTLGNYTVPDKDYSKGSESNYITQSIGLGLSMQFEKYSQIIGFNVMHSYRKDLIRSETDLVDYRKQKAVNYAPRLSFKYRFNKQTNLSLQYNGQTQQPSIQQLSPIRDVTNPLSETYGNPNLKPSFIHQLNIQFSKFNYESGRFFNLSVNGRYLSNDIIESSVTDYETGKRVSTYMNSGGRWSINNYFTINTPVINKKITLSLSAHSSYRQVESFLNRESNLSRSLSTRTSINLNFSSKVIFCGLGGAIDYSNTKNSIAQNEKQEFLDYNANFNTIVNLPLDVSIESSLNFSANSGYSKSFAKDQWIWNASLQKMFLRQKNGILKLELYDILKQRSSINQYVTASYINETKSNTLTSYILLTLIYRFNIFGQSSN